MRTDINMPFALKWDGKELDLVAKTVMRKSNFSNKPTQNFPLRNLSMRKVPNTADAMKRYISSSNGFTDIAHLKEQKD